MSVSGNRIGHFSWGCSNTYGQFNITFNANGTFGGTFPGKWVQQDGTLYEVLTTARPSMAGPSTGALDRGQCRPSAEQMAAGI